MGKFRYWWIPLPISLVAGLLLGHGFAWAQSGQVPVQADVWASLITSGPMAVVLAFGLWTVNAERKQLQKERDALLERTLTVIHNVTSSLNDVASTNSSVGVGINSIVEYIKIRDRE